MSKHLGLASLVSLAVVVSACGGGSDLGGGERYLGTYLVTSHRRNTPVGAQTVPCTDFGAETTGEEAYIKIVVDDFSGDPDFLEMETCMTDPGACGFGFVSFEAHGDRLIGENWNTQTGGGATCQLYASRDSGTLVGGAIRIESISWYGTSDDPGCDLDLAEALLSTTSCERTEAWEGTRQ